MEITRDVITDLLPVYLSGEASQDTKELVETFLKRDREFANLVQQQDELRLDNQISLTEDIEMEILNRTRALLRKRSWYMAFAIAFSLWPFAFRGGASGVHWLWADAPFIAVLLGLVGIFFWIKFAMVARQLNGSAL